MNRSIFPHIFTPVLILLLALVLGTGTLFSSPYDKGQRKRVYVLIGGGYAFPRFGGPGAEIGAELRLFDAVYARFLIDYYGGSDIKKNSETIQNALGFNLSALYKIPLSEILTCSLALGAHYSFVASEVSVFGVTYSETTAILGFQCGFGTQWQISNRLLINIESTLKYMKTDDPWFWLKVQIGLLVRVR